MRLKKKRKLKDRRRRDDEGGDNDDQPQYVVTLGTPEAASEPEVEEQIEEVEKKALKKKRVRIAATPEDAEEMALRLLQSEF